MPIFARHPPAQFPALLLGVNNLLKVRPLPNNRENGINVSPRPPRRIDPKRLERPVRRGLPGIVGVAVVANKDDALPKPPLGDPRFHNVTSRYTRFVTSL
jgi:hypothetical protein